MPLLTARGVTKSVGEGRAARRLLDGADLDLEAGEIVAILGRSGSGKSTFLNLIGGIDAVDEGMIEVGGRRVDRLDGAGLTSYRREQVGFVFQLFHLIPEGRRRRPHRPQRPPLPLSAMLEAPARS